MDPLRLCLALGPLTIYLFAVATLNLMRRPVVVSGVRDTAALGIGVSGLLLVGPIELLLPTQVIAHFGRNVWLMWAMILCTYSLTLTLLVLLGRPRIVVYNASQAVLRAALAEVLDLLDGEARWAGNSLVLPRLRVELHLESNPALRNISLVAASDSQSYTGWKILEKALAQQLGQTPVPVNPWGWGLLAVTLLFAGRLTYELTTQSQKIAQGFYDLLRW